MSLVLNEFKSDIGRVRKLIEAFELFRAFRALSTTYVTPDEAYFQHVAKIQNSSNECHTDLVILCGTLVLYVAGRFEFFVRTLFEELCDQVAARCASYDKLPRVMRGNLISFTAEVMKDPRKYGHGEKGVESFIKILAANITDRTKIEGINSACLSITHENMRAETLKELFERIGAKDIWEKIAQQAGILTLFETADVSNAKSKALTMLNDFMELRNKIAHPSASVTWPDSGTVLENCKFLEILAEAIVGITGVYEVALAPT